MHPFLRTRRDFIRAAGSTVAAGGVAWASALLRPTAAELSPAQFISNIRECTISTDRLQDSIHYYCEHFGFEVARRTTLQDAAWRSLWRLPEGTSATAVLLAAPHSHIGSIRLVRFSPLAKIFAHLPYRN